MAVGDVAVIGGGIAGTAAAAYLAEVGLRVTLYERRSIAAGASGRNSGVVQHPFDPVLSSLYRVTLDAYRDLAAGDGSTFRLADVPCGMLAIGRDAAAARRLAIEWRDAYPDSDPEVLAGKDLRALEPALAPDLIACRLAIGYPVAPAAATEAFAALARRRNVEIKFDGDARLADDGTRVRGVEWNGALHPADAVVVAAGPWTPAVVDPTGRWRPIRPSWGVVASVALDHAPGHPPRHALEAIDIRIEPTDGPGLAPAASPGGRDDAVEFSLIPAIGSSALGSTFLPEEPDVADWPDALRRVGSRYVPAVGSAPVVGLRACARPVSGDGRPLIGRAPWRDGLWILAGHGPWGISTAPGSARLLVDELVGRRSSGSIPAELAPDRFGAPGQRQEFASVT